MQSPTLVVTNSMVRPSEYSPMAMLAIAQREGEDAKLTGMTRSLHRRLLALNVCGSMRTERKPLSSVSLSTSELIKRIA